ncbi:MAG TPA: type II toxin-antitoxin system RelE/ParE family toxin [Chromatiaceae bacterium]|nr:type II toxin-antitoxin system RelE/ParE family toxin [Chromatiaceae bacterium]HIP70518.1 type II toxin-antitoxin system RelE/ParE family toxin [Anaerolineae bacterium]
MADFRIVLTEEAQSDIRKLETRLQNRILDKLEWIGANATLLRHQSLQGDKWKNTCKYRIGDYRIIYRLNHQDRVLTVLKVGHRRDVYRF